MNQRSTNKRSAKTLGIKTLIATASVAATVAGWALLPANDPTAGAAANSQVQQPVLSVPGTDQNGANGVDGLPLPPGTQQTSPSTPNSNLPSLGSPRSSSSMPMPFTRTHSSR